MDIDKDLDDNEIFELSRSQILEVSNDETESLFGLRNSAGLKRQFKVPADYVDGFEYGIDVSHWQNQINWTRVAAAKAAYAYIKATQGGSYVDPRLTANITGATNAGVRAGCYHFLSANTSVNSQIENFKRRYGVYHDIGRLPPCMDLEWDYNSSGVDRWANKSASFIVDKSSKWLEAIVVEYGVAPIFYTNKSWFSNRVGNDKSLNNYGVWMSRYGGYGNDAPAMMTGYDWVCWQFTDRGTISGVSGKVDVNLSATGFPGVSKLSAPIEPYKIPDTPLAQVEMSADEIAETYAAVRAKFGGLTSVQVEHLSVLINTSTPNDLRSFAKGAIDSPLSVDEKACYFELARAELANGTLNRGQVDMLDLLLTFASPTAVRQHLLNRIGV